MDPQDGPPFDLTDAHSDYARIAQATGMVVQLFGLGAREALVILDAVALVKCLSTSSVARKLVEEWP